MEMEMEIEMVVPATSAARKKKRAREEEERCPCCERSPCCERCRRTRTESAEFISYSLPAGAFTRFFPSLVPPGARDFTLQVTAQTATLPVRWEDPSLVLRLRGVRRWVERRPLSAVSPFSEGFGEVVSLSRVSFEMQHESSAARFLTADTAMADVRRLLAAVSDVGDSIPWASLPISYFAADAAARIHKFVRGFWRSGSLGRERFNCHLDITFVQPSPLVWIWVNGQDEKKVDEVKVSYRPKLVV